MIDYKEKGSGLHEKIAALGHWMRQEDGQWISSNDAEVQAVIDGYTADEARAPIIINVKLAARQRILAFLPDWKQSNLNARMNELNLDRATREWTADEQAEIAALQALWNRAKAIRDASNTHEANLIALGDDFAAINAYDIGSGWPE